MMFRKFYLTVFLFIVLFGNGFSQHESDSLQIKRLVKLCELWGKVKNFHPYFSYKSIDWDSALVKTISKVNTAGTSAEFAKAIDEMLIVLGDPATYVIKDDQKQSDMALSLPGEQHPYLHFEKDSMLIVEMSDYSDLGNTAQAVPLLASIKNKINKSHAVIFDLRRLTKEGFTWGSPAALFDQTQLTNLLFSAGKSFPGTRFRVTFGLPAVTHRLTYQSGYVTQVDPVPNHTPFDIGVPLFFLVNKNTPIPNIALSLQHAGVAVFIAEGDVTDESFAKQMKVDMGESVRVNLRTAELIFPDGATGFTPNVKIGPYENDREALKWTTDYAQSIIKGKEKLPVPVKGNISALPNLGYDKAYNDMKFPSEEYRMLAVFRIWNMVEYFFPYKNLMDKNWNRALPYFIDKFKKASNATEYDLSVAEMIAWLQDSHSAGFGVNVLRSVYGPGYPPINVRMIENSPVVFKVAHDSITKKFDIRVGDEILKVDGESALERINKFRMYISASTKDLHMSTTASALFYGPDHSEVQLDVRGLDGKVRKVKLPRSSARPITSKRSGEIIKKLNDNIGYIDMDRLQEDQLDEVKKMLDQVKGVIMDMRGYPSSGAPFEIASWFSKNQHVLIEVPIALNEGNKWSDINYRLESGRDPDEKKHHYEMPTVVLIDEYTQSAAETFTMHMHQSPSTTIIGGNSSGADGVITNFFIPGGRLINFTGMVFAYQDGRQVQRIGIVPDIYSKRTLKGFQKGKDEVLERAVKYLQK